MTAEEELAPILAELQRTHDVLPFFEQQIPATAAAFRPLPEDMADLITASPDFRPPERGAGPLWLQLESEGDHHGVLIVARPAADGELWVIAPREREPRPGGSNPI